jgi:adenosylcobinamide-GDP ribazoletransferase
MVLAGVYWILAALLPMPVCALLIVALWAGLTGALHLDGLSDCGDGLLASVPRERRLEIMRDPRVGSFAVVTLILVLLVKAGATGGAHSPMLALILAPAWARWLLLLAAQAPAARPGGMGEALKHSLTPAIIVRASVVPLSVILVGAWFDWRALAGAGLAALAAWAVVLLAKRRIGGVTGDVFGAVVEIGETVLLVAFCLTL